MESIVKGNNKTQRILGKQRLSFTEYRIMNYVLQAEFDDGLLFHNTITGQMVLLSPKEKDVLERMPIKYEDSLVPLIENYFLVPVNYDEKKLVDNLRQILKAIDTQKGINSYTIMTTTNCNARCFYCYQAGYTHINMTHDTANNLVDYIVKNKGDKPIRIQWFGGEPLVCINRIDQICDRLERAGISFSSSMISNGYLFTEGIADKAVNKWNLKNIQITLDGTEFVYNKTKAYISTDESPFKRVIRNIKTLLKHGIYVNIRLNLDQHNCNDLIDLLSLIIEMFPEKKNLSAYTHVVYENEGFAPISRNEMEKKALYSQMLQLNRRITECGLSRYYLSLPSLKYRSCMADSPGSVLIYPDGTLYKCEHTVKGEEFGHIQSDSIDTDKVKMYSIPYSMTKCERCVLYPSCFILEKCDGIKDRNSATCEFDIEMKSLTLVYQYRKYKSIELKESTLRETNTGFDNSYNGGLISSTNC